MLNVLVFLLPSSFFIGFSESCAGSMGVRERLFQERRESSPPRDTAPQNIAGDWSSSGSASSGGDGCGGGSSGGANCVAVKLGRRAGDIVELVAGGGGSPEHELHDYAGAPGGERAVEEGEHAAESRVDSAEGTLQ